MAETERARREQGLNTQPLEANSQTQLCPNCREPYSWMCGEDCMPTSLSCGHSLCFRCAKSQWCSPGSEESAVLCVTCSASVAVTTYKPAPVSRPEDGLPSSAKAEDCDSAVMDNPDASDNVEPVQNTPTHLPSTADGIQPHSSERKQVSSVGCSVEKAASTLSSPLVLDKIQSQDDAWRLLQHDEGFIRDWIVANVPDHVIFKMVGVGGSDSAVDGSSIVLSNGNTVVISSPPKTEDVAMTTPEMAGGSGGQGEGVVRSSFEQQFLHYLVSKAAPQDKPASVVDVEREPGLPGALTTVESAAQTAPDALTDEGGAIASSSSSENKSVAMRIVKQGLKRMQPGDVGVFHVGKSSQLPNGMIEGAASPLGAGGQEQVLQSVTGQHAEAGQYDPGPDPDQSVLALQAPPPPPNHAYGSCVPTANLSYHPTSVQQHPYQDSYASPMFGNSNRPVARFPVYPIQRSFQPPDAGVFASSHHRLYGSYPFSYPQHLHPSWFSQGGPPYPRMAQRFQPGPFQRCAQFVPHRGERGYGRDSGPAFPPPSVRSSSEFSWASKACTPALNPPPPPSTLPTQPQIRFVQVVRPKADLGGLPEPPRAEEDAAPSSATVREENRGEETSAADSPGDSEAEVALMKTRNMPHGAQVEDIYVVPQVWLTGGRGPLPAESLQQSEGLAFPYPGGSPLRPSCHAAVSGTDHEPLGPGAQPSPEKPADSYDSELPNSLVVLGSGVSLVKREPAPETSDTLGAPETAAGCLSERPEEAGCGKDNDYADFKPVAVVTTISVSKTQMSSEPETEATASDIPALPVPPPLICASSTVTTAPVDSDSATSAWTPSTETPVRDTAVTMDSGPDKGSIGQVPPAPVKKLDGHLEWKHSAQDASLGPDIVQLSQQNGEESATALSSSRYITGPCNKTAHDALMSELTRRAEGDTHTLASTSDVEIIEGKSSLASAIMFPRQNPAEIPQNRKRFRRNLSSEFYNSDVGLGSSYYADQLAERRAYSRSGRQYPSKYAQYSSAYRSPPHTPYPNHYPYGYGPRPYYYSGFANAPNTALRYRPPYPYPEMFPQSGANKPSDYQFGMPVDDPTGPRSVYSLLGRSAAHPHHPYPYPPFRPRGAPYPTPVSQTVGSCLSQPYPDVLSHLSSGRGDYSNTSSSTYSAQPKAPQEGGNFTPKTTDLSAGDDPPVRRHGFWPDREESGGTGDGDCCSGRHQVPLHDLDTVRWIQQQVGELNKEIGSGTLTRLEGCLALLEKNAYQANGTDVPSGSWGGDARDMDHLWRCILTLGKAVVQYGWWCRPHHWDSSSQRWAEMAMLASDIFTRSMQSLVEVIIFYLDHTCTTMLPPHCEGEIEGRDFLDRRMGETSEDQPVDGSVQMTYRYPAPASVHQPDYVLPSGQQPQAYRNAVGQPGHPAVDSSQPPASHYPQPHGFPSSDDQIRSVTVDPPESYVPHPSPFSQYRGEKDAGLLSPEIPPGGADHPSFAVEDRSGEQETTPSVVYHYQVSDITMETAQSGLYHDGNVDSGYHAKPSGSTPDAAQPMSCDRPREAESPSMELPSEAASVLDSVHVDRPTTVVVSGTGVEQTGMEVYYTVEGSLMHGVAPDSGTVTPAQASCEEDEERVCGENIVYAVSHLTEVDHPGEVCLDSSVGYNLSSQVEQPPQQRPMTPDNMTAKPADVADDVADDDILPPDPPPPRLPKESTGADCLKDLCHQNHNTTELVSTDVTAAEAETVSHGDPTEVKLFMVTVPVERVDSQHVECSGLEVISDTAIMLSETVEIETDGTVEVNGTKESESGGRIPRARRGSPDHKENIDSSTCSGKRKRTRTPQSKNKHLKQDLGHEKQSAKGTLAVKSGKWNLRSSRGSVPENFQSTTISK